MTETGAVNYPKLEEILEYQIANGTDAIIICGTTGESSTLSHEEHLEAIRFTAEKVAGRIPVIAGTGSNCTETAIYLSQEAEKYGVDGVLLVTPYYNKATQKGLIAHFTKIANSIKIPVILYNIQSRTGVNIAPETMAYLAKNVENIVGVKEASGNISQIAKIRNSVVSPLIFIPEMMTRSYRFFHLAEKIYLRTFQYCTERDSRYRGKIHGTEM